MLNVSLELRLVKSTRRLARNSTHFGWLRVLNLVSHLTKSFVGLKVRLMAARVFFEDRGLK